MKWRGIRKEADEIAHHHRRALWASSVPQMVTNLPTIPETQVGFSRSWRSPREGNGYPLQYSCLENPMHRGAWWATVHGVAKNQAWLSLSKKSSRKTLSLEIKICNKGNEWQRGLAQVPALSWHCPFWQKLQVLGKEIQSWSIPLTRHQLGIPGKTTFDFEFIMLNGDKRTTFPLPPFSSPSHGVEMCVCASTLSFYLFPS